jgi:hypothetical protein
MAQLQVEIPDEVMAKLKAKAALRDETLKVMVNKILLGAVARKAA